MVAGEIFHSFIFILTSLINLLLKYSILNTVSQGFSEKQTNRKWGQGRKREREEERKRDHKV